MPKLNILPDLLYRAKRDGFSDRQLAEIFRVSEKEHYRSVQLETIIATKFVLVAKKKHGKFTLARQASNS